jgi:hypothetical protein
MLAFSAAKTVSNNKHLVSNVLQLLSCYNLQLGADIIAIYTHVNDSATAGVAVNRSKETGQGFNSSANFVALALGAFDDETLVHEIAHLQVICGLFGICVSLGRESVRFSSTSGSLPLTVSSCLCACHNDMCSRSRP